LSTSLSVVMPIRGEGMFLDAALRSLLWQTMPVDELVVVDDGMSESVRARLSAFESGPVRLAVVAGERAGPAAARNCGLSAARGDVVGFIDDDDVWPRDKLSGQLALLRSDPQVEAVGGRIRWFSAWDEAAEVPAETPDVKDVVHVNLGAYLFRRSVFEKIGHLDATHMFAEDVDFILRMADHDIRFVILEAVTLYYRRHPHSMTAERSEREKADYRRALLRSLGRNRHRRSEGLRSLSARLLTDRKGEPLADR
jgi:glycosyltransferase involved in cell wall biosynthesis